MHCRVLAQNILVVGPQANHQTFHLGQPVTGDRSPINSRLTCGLLVSHILSITLCPCIIYHHTYPWHLSPPVDSSNHSNEMSQLSTITRSTQLPVLIIGSGLGGLTLAHSLAKHRIPYRIYERDSAASQRAQGYRVSIDEGGANGLRNALDAKTFQRFEETCAASNPVGGRIDGPSGKVLQRGILGLLGSGGITMIVALLYRFLSKRLENGKWKGWLWSWSEFKLDDVLTIC